MNDTILERFGTNEPTFVLEVVPVSDMHIKLRQLRAAGADDPIGCVVPDEADALAALRAGADEAVVMHEPVAQDIHAFVDRTILRAGLRQEDRARAVATPDS